MDNHYQILGVTNNASQEEIKNRYRFLVFAYHPDRFSNPEMKQHAEEEMKRINDAYTILSDPNKRMKFDETYHSEKEEDQQQETEKNGEKMSIYLDQLVSKRKNIVSTLPDTLEITNVNDKIFKVITDYLNIISNSKDHPEINKSLVEISGGISRLKQISVSLGIEISNNEIPPNFKLLELIVYSQTNFLTKFNKIVDSLKRLGYYSEKSYQLCSKSLTKLLPELCQSCINSGVNYSNNKEVTFQKIKGEEVDSKTKNKRWQYGIPLIAIILIIFMVFLSNNGNFLQQKISQIPTIAAVEIPTPETTDISDSVIQRADCQVISSDPAPQILELIPPVSDTDWVQGDENAPVTIIVYSDMQCPYCARFDPMVNQLVQEHPEEVRTVFRHFPIPGHANAVITAQAMEAAGKQSYEKFFELKDFLFAEQQTWTGLEAAAFETWLMDNIGQFDLDVDQFEKDLKSEEIVNIVKKAQEHAINVGIPGTPFTLYNYKNFSPTDYASLEGVLKLAELEKSLFTECPPDVLEPDKKYTAILKTDKGDIVLELLRDVAPITVNSFVFLAQNDWFDNITFHRVIPDFVAQSGDPSGTGMGYPGYNYANEINMDLKFDAPGVVGMANSGPNTNGSQFFISYGALPQLDGQYTIFAKVIDGMAVVEALTERIPEAGGDLLEGDVIRDVVIEAK